VICHSCGAEIAEGVNFCTYCGAEQKPVDLKICKKCNYANRMDANNCKKCGGNLTKEGQEYVLTSTGVKRDDIPPAGQPPQPQRQGIPHRGAQRAAAPSLPPFGTEMHQAEAPAPQPPVQRQPAQQQAVQSPFLAPPPSAGPIKMPQQQPPIIQPRQSAQPPIAVRQPAISGEAASQGLQSPQIKIQPRPQVPLPSAQSYRPPVQPIVPDAYAGLNKPVQPGIPPVAADVKAAGPQNINPVPPSPNINQMQEIPNKTPIPQPSVKPPQTGGAGAFLFCNICGAKNEADLNECKYCQSPLKKAGTPSYPADISFNTQAERTEELKADLLKSKGNVGAEAEGTDDKPTGVKGKICKKCNTENPAMMLICYNCGESLDDQEKNLEPAFRTTAQYSIPRPSAPDQSAFSDIPPVPVSVGEGSEPHQVHIPEPSKKMCPKCGTPNLLGSTKCGHCGFLFKKDDSFNDDTETKPFLVCPKCYFRNAVDAVECAKCHMTLKILPNVKVKDLGGFPSIGDSTVKCPVCGVDNPREVLSCKHCNYNFLKKKQEIIQIAPPIIPEGDRIACPRCGSDNGKNEQHCRICGEKLNKQPTVEIPAYSQQKIVAFPPAGSAGSGIPQPPLPGGTGAIPSKANLNTGTDDQAFITNNSFQPDSGTFPAPGRIGQKIPIVQKGPAPSNVPKPYSGGSSAAPPPPIGIAAGGTVAEPNVQFVPDWKEGKKSGKETPANNMSGKSERPKGTFRAKTAIIIIGIVVAIVIVAVVLMLLESGGSEKTSSDIPKQGDKGTSTSGSEEGLTVEDIKGSEVSSSQKTGSNIRPSEKGSDVGSLETVGGNSASIKPSEKQTGIVAVEDKAASEISDMVTKGKDALKRGRINYPKNNNAIYYYQQARDIGADSSDLEELKNQLNMALHALGDKKLGERAFKEANIFYDLAAQVDPEDTGVKRKKSQVRELQRKTENEKKELDAAIKTQSITEIERFIDKYPTSPYAINAQQEIVNLKRLKQDAEAREELRKKDEEELKAYEEKQYVFNVVHSYFMGQNRGKLIINRKGILFEPVDKKIERFYAVYSQIESLVFEDGEIVIKFNQSMGDVGDEITLKHITESDPKTKQIFDAYQELKPKQ
jgi:ribosomal protein L40E